jgi:hypothetical protein
MRRRQGTVGSLGRKVDMLWTIFVIVVALWLVGVVTASSFGGLIHLLLIVALATVLIRFIQGRRSAV